MFKYPIAIEIDLTYNCNYKCIYCRNGLIKDKKELEFKVVERLLEEAITNNVFHINISGGEPTLYSHFRETIEYLGRSNLVWSLTTNGSLFDSELVYLLKANNINSVFITLTGMSEKSDNYHKKVRNSFEKTLKAIDLCVKENIDVSIGYLLTPYNLDEVNSFIDFVKKKQIKAKLMKVKPLGTSLQNQNICIDNVTYTSVKNRMIEELKDYLIIGEQSQKVEQINCMAGKTDCVIGADYNVYPCVMFLGEEKLVCGSVQNDTLFNIWNNSEILNKFRKERIFAQSCGKCGKKDKCNGGCRGNAFLKYGDYNYIDGECDYV